MNSTDTLLLPTYSDFMQVINDALPESTFSLKLVEVDLLDETKNTAIALGIITSLLKEHCE